MNKGTKKKSSGLTIFIFVFGLIMYLSGLLLLLSSSIKKAGFIRVFNSSVVVTSDMIVKLKILGAILFLVGFLLFLLAVIFLYKEDKIQENNVNLIIEGKADVITIIVMTYVMIFMLVVCLVFNEYIGAFLFGFAIVIQTIINSLLIRLYNKSYKRK
ncbi:MAG: hypothetical protein II625_02985 [Bacilli bacterium]|nr:hypothetical protein [Bacilli bacterium]